MNSAAVSASHTVRPSPWRVAGPLSRLPPTSYFVTSAVFHYLGPSLAVLLFVHVQVLGVAWLRIASAAVLFALWRRPWRIWNRTTVEQRWVFAGLGTVLAVMNSLFYLAVDRLPLSTVGAIEFLGVIILAAAGARTRRNLLALLLAMAGVFVLTELRLTGQPLGFVFAFGNCVGFMVYVMLGHRIANTAAGETPAGESSAGESPADPADTPGCTMPPDQPAADPFSGIDQLGLAMIIAAVVATPVGIAAAVPTFGHPLWLAWGIGVGLCSSVIPYVTDQLAMARLPRATFALMLALLPATATVIGLLVLSQTPTAHDLIGIALVIAGIVLHHDSGTIESDPPIESDPMAQGTKTSRATDPNRAMEPGRARTIRTIGPLWPVPTRGPHRLLGPRHRPPERPRPEPVP
jgi:inner membrane transporter RhtA